MEIVLPEIVSIGVFNAQNIAQNKNLTKKRTTTMFEIEIPIENGGVSYINSDGIAVEPSFVICAKPGQTRQTRLPFKCYYIHFILNSGVLYDTLMNMQSFVKTDRFDKYKEMFERMHRYFETAVEADEIILQSLVMELIYTLSKDSQRLKKREQIKTNNYEVIERAIKYIKGNLTSDLSLNTVSLYAGMSPIHFHNCFKTATARTLHQYVEEQRIKKAANMLITTDATLTEVAYECGFSSQSYFSYAFKRKMSVTPREYAKRVFGRYEKEI
ncbi:MAG: helix-turn-helix transcriptional regulator [Clostridia bacterium]|nr:helix-turn-helix transcriptional regulator [Clostridia bacterium]